MLYMQRTTLTALVAFVPIFGALWFGAPWSKAQTNFELAGTTFLSEMRARFSDLDSAQISPTDSTAWLDSEETVKAVIGSLPRHHLAALTETGETWSIKFRERMRALACSQPLNGWRIDDRSLCAWLGDWLKPQRHTDQLDVIDERLAIQQSADGQHIEITFRAANPDVAASVVGAFGDRLEERHNAARQDLRRRLVESIESEFARREAMLKVFLSESKRLTEDDDDGEISELGLLGKFTAALTRAQTELPAKDRQQLSKELEAVEVAFQDEVLSRAADRVSADMAKNHADEAPAVGPTELLTILSHPEWSNPPIMKRSATTDGFSFSRIALIAFILSLMSGLALSAIWPLLQHRSDQRHSSFASPYANPYWPNMRVLERVEPNEAA